MSQVRDSFQHWLNSLFLEDELEEIVLPYRNEYFDIIKEVE